MKLVGQLNMICLLNRSGLGWVFLTRIWSEHDTNSTWHDPLSALSLAQCIVPYVFGNGYNYLYHIYNRSKTHLYRWMSFKVQRYDINVVWWEMMHIAWFLSTIYERSARVDLWDELIKVVGPN